MSSCGLQVPRDIIRKHSAQGMGARTPGDIFFRRSDGVVKPNRRPFAKIVQGGPVQPQLVGNSEDMEAAGLVLADLLEDLPRLTSRSAAEPSSSLVREQKLRRVGADGARRCQADVERRSGAAVSKKVACESVCACMHA